MKSIKVSIAAFIFAIVFIFSATNSVKAVELITNGGFETGNFTGWTATNAPGPFELWRVTGSGQGYVDSPVPTATSVILGSFNAHQAVASNIGSFTLVQQISIPAGNAATFTWRHRYQMNLTTYCTGAACGTATFAVEILNTSNVVLQTVYTITTPSSSNTNTGWLSNSANLSAYAGQTIRIRYRTTVTANLQGPGRLEVDGVSVNALPLLAADGSVTGRVSLPSGRGISRATLSITDSQTGEVKTATTNPFGYYRFTELETGHFYILNVARKGYIFEPDSQSFQVNDNLEGINFIGSPPE